MKNFWDNLPEPFFALAPMADVTDAAFRRVIARESAHERADGVTGGPDIMWTEFVSADGLVRASAEGKEKLRKDLLYSDAERPIVAQLFGSNVEAMREAAALCEELGFDGIDINMGCPDRSIEKQGAGAAMIKEPNSALAVIGAARRGAPHLPVSVKTRLGYNTDVLDEWLPILLSVEPAVVTIHARTRKEMSKVPARWNRIADAVRIRDTSGARTHIIGNGDVLGLPDARQKAEETGADGVMLGRAIFGNPWLFHPEKDAATVPLTEKLMVMCEHTDLFEELLGHKSFAIMKKHYKAYVNGFDGAKELRMELMDAEDARGVRAIIERFVHAGGVAKT